MSASIHPGPEWLDAAFWERLHRLDRWHRLAQWDHERAERGLKRLSMSRADAQDLHQAWQRYCKAIAELDRVTAEIESMRTCVR